MKVLRGRFVIGTIVVILGIIALLNNLGIIQVSMSYIVRTYWPLLLIFWSFTLFEDFWKERRVKDKEIRTFLPWGQLISGAVVLVIGIIYLGRNLELFEIDLSLFWQIFWPVIIILFGINLLKGRPSPQEGKGQWAFMGGIDLGKTPFDLKPGSYLAFLGGVDMDLSSANIPPGETLLDLTAVMGGIDVKVPKDLNIICEGTALLGGIEFLKESTGGIIASKRVEYKANEDDRVVRFQARTLMGGIDIKQE